MKAKILLILIVAALCSFSYSLGYGYGSSNMGYYYPSLVDISLIILLLKNLVAILMKPKNMSIIAMQISN